MNEIILMKLGELVLKGLNRRSFEDKLISNAMRRLRPHGVFRVYSKQSTMYVEPRDDSCDMDGAWEAMKKLFGVVGLSRARACGKDKQEMLETAKTYLCDQLMAARSFKVEAKRADKSFPMTSIQLAQYVGGELHDAFPHLTADMHHPDLTVHLEVRDYAAFVHADPEPGAGGGHRRPGGEPPLRRHRLPGGLLDDRQAGHRPGDGPLLLLPLHLPRGEGQGH